MRDKEAVYQHVIIICLRRGKMLVPRTNFFSPKTGRSSRGSWGSSISIPFTKDISVRGYPPQSTHLPKTIFPLVSLCPTGFWLAQAAFWSSWTRVDRLVEVDALDSGMVAVLSQQVEGKLHPCAFFSQHLSQAEWNYGMWSRTGYSPFLFALALLLSLSAAQLG